MLHRRSECARVLALALLLAGGALACTTTQEVRQNEFSDVQKHYTQLVRWAQFERAKGYVDPEAVAEFETQAAALSDVRFTDYAIRGVQYGQDGTATVQVTYYAYLRTALIAFAYDEQQVWSRPEGGAWRVRSTFAQRNVTPGEGMF